MSDATTSVLSIKMFGPLEMWRDGSLVMNLHLRDGARLLAFLVLHHGRPVANSLAAETLWPATSSLDSLRQSVTHLRRILGSEADRVQSHKGSLMLATDNAQVDLVAFDSAVARMNIVDLKEAITLYRGPLLHPWDEIWVLKEREKRREKYLEALKLLSRDCRANHDPRGSVHYLRRYVQVSPGEEQAWSDLMHAHVAAEERVAAIEIYQKFRDYLMHRYKMAPPAEMTALYNRLQESPTGARGGPPAIAMDPVGGAVPLGSPFYIERPPDPLFKGAITRRDSIVLVKGPRQTGKTSLLARGLQQARNLGMQVVLTDFQKISAAHWASTETLYMAVMQSLTDQLGIPGSLQDAWDPLRGSNENFERFLRRDVLGRLTAPLVWGMDEIDRLFTWPHKNEIFALFRAWHNERSLDPLGPWDRFTLAIAYATEAHLFISDLNQSPFSVGTRLTLEDFTREQIERLNSRYGAPLQDDAQIENFARLVGGHPYLVRRGMHEIVSREIPMSRFVAGAHREDGPFADHLQRLLLALRQDHDLCEAVRMMLRNLPCPTLSDFYRLKSAGLAVGDSLEDASFRCELYRTYLAAHI